MSSVVETGFSVDHDRSQSADSRSGKGEWHSTVWLGKENDPFVLQSADVPRLVVIDFELGWCDWRALHPNEFIEVDGSLHAKYEHA